MHTITVRSYDEAALLAHACRVADAEKARGFTLLSAEHGRHEIGTMYSMTLRFDAAQAEAAA